VRHSVFTVEVCADIDRGPALLEELRPIVQGSPPVMTRSEAWGRHAAAAEAVLRSMHAVERGCWEYFDDEARAMSMFNDWCRPVVDRVLPREEPTMGDGYRDGVKRYLTFTMVYLLARDSPSDVLVRRSCRIATPDLWRRATFRRLLAIVRALSFASVKADAMYLAPRDAGWGLTQEDLGAEKYAYLRELILD
jgi:hypothetical protein